MIWNRQATRSSAGRDFIEDNRNTIYIDFLIINIDIKFSHSFITIRFMKS